MNKRQTEETAKFCLDIAKLLLAAWVIGLFTVVPDQRLIVGLSGLTTSALFYILGMRLLKEEK